MTRAERERVKAETLQKIEETLQEHPEIRERTAKFFATDPSRDELKALQPGVHASTLRKRRLRERRRHAGMKAYELWLDATGQALIDELRRTDESLDALVSRALVTVLTRLRAMQAEGLSRQAIADRLNAEGTPTLSGRGQWQKGTIANLLAQVEDR
jgi:hypothetical protein